MASLQEARTKMTYEVAVYKEQLNLLRKEMERISLTTLDISNAAKSLEDLKEQNALVSIGGGVYVRAHIKETSVLVPIGADYVAEMDQKDALLEMHKRVDATREAVTKLNEEFEKITNKLKDVAAKLSDVEKQAKISQRVEEGVRDDYI